jgi:transposase-like protein
MRKIIDPDRKASILAEAELLGDTRVAQTHGVSTRTLRRWRVDPKISPLIPSKRQQLQGDWTRSLDSALCQSLDAIVESIRELPKDAESVEALVKAVKILGDLALNLEVLRGKL